MGKIMVVCDVVLLIFAILSLFLGAKIGPEAFGVVGMAFGVGTLVGARFVIYLHRNY